MWPALVLVLLSAVDGYAQVPALRDLLADDREEWRVAILRFRGAGLDAGNEYLTTSLPRLLWEDVGDIEEHRLSDESIQGYRRRIVSDARLEIGRRLTRARSARDDLLFDRLDAKEYAEEYAESTREIDALREQLDRTEDYPLNQIDVRRRKPVTIVSADGQLLTTDEEDVSEVADEEDLDLVIFGSVEQLEEYVWVEVFSYSRFEEETRSIGATAARPDEIYRAVGEIQASVARAILGRDWAHLRVGASGRSTVSVDGTLQGIGTVDVRYLPPGDVEIRVERPGYVPETRIVTLLPFQTAEVSVTLEAADTETILIVSEPESADVYVRSVWSGRTPVAVPRPSIPTDVTLSVEGFRENSFSISQVSPERIERSLVPIDRDWQQYIRRRRDVFYSALGAFALSVPVPVVLGALFDDAAARYESSEASADIDDLRRLVRTANAYFYGRYAALTVTLGLLGNTIWQLRRYIRAAQYQPEGE